MSEKAPLSDATTVKTPVTTYLTFKAQMMILIDRQVHKQWYTRLGAQILPDTFYEHESTAYARYSQQHMPNVCLFSLNSVYALELLFESQYIVNLEKDGLYKSNL